MKKIESYSLTPRLRTVVGRTAEPSGRILRAWLRIASVTVAAIALTMLASCPPPPAATSHSLVVKLIDLYTGAPVSNATVTFAGLAATTGSDGACLIDLSGSSGTLTGAFGIYGGAHQSYLLENVSLDTAADTSVTIKVQPPSLPTVTHTVTGHLYETQSPGGPTEIENGSQAQFIVLNSAGGGGATIHGDYNYDRSTGFSFETATFGSDCLVYAYVAPLGLDPFNLVLANTDLSGTTTALAAADTTQDTASTQTITVTGSSTENKFALSLVTPYGMFLTLGGDFASSTTVQVKLSNPYGYSGVWTQLVQKSDTPAAGYQTSKISNSSVVTLAGSITLSAISDLGLSGYSDPSTLSYSGGTLEVDPATSAGFYVFELRDSGSGDRLATVVSQSSSVALPAWLKNLLSGKTVTVGVSAAASNFQWDLSTVADEMSNRNVVPGTQMQLVASTSTADLSF